MTVASIIPDATSGLDAFLFDVQLSEVHEHTNEPTEFPIELGADVTDHVRVKPDQVTLTGVITNAPIDEVDGGFTGSVDLGIEPFQPPAFSSVANAIDAAGSAIANALFGPPPPTIVSLLQFPVPIDPILDAHTLLLSYKTGRVLCDVVTTTQQYSSMVVTSIQMHRDGTEKAEFTVVLKQIVQVQTATVAAPTPSIPAGAPKVSAGSQGTTAPTDAQKSTILNKLVGAVAGP